ncbi:MAG TPA: phosphopantetheine-binding protein [Candidatus Obscuribacterales bacterium]
MVDEEQLVSLVTSAVKDACGDRDIAVPEDLGPETKLFGAGGCLDSLSLVSLLVDIEQRLEQEFGAIVTIADDRAMSRRRSPFRTVRTLTDYIHVLLESRNDHDRS